MTVAEFDSKSIEITFQQRFDILSAHKKLFTDQKIVKYILKVHNEMGLIFFSYFSTTILKNLESYTYDFIPLILMIANF